MTCNDIEKRLPAYLEHLLSPAENELLEGHLSSCVHCRRACEDLRKAEGIVRNLPEVEPPPFFEQRIMSRVREEALQKPGILRRLFRPLYRKVPPQAFAALLVAVMAFSIYRTIVPEWKDLAPSAVTVPEPAKDQTAAEYRKASTTPAAATPVMTAPEKDLRNNKKRGFAAPPGAEGTKADRVAGSPSPLQEERVSAAKPTAPAMADREKESQQLRAEVLSRPSDRTDQQKTAQSFKTALPEHTRQGRMAYLGAAPAPSEKTDAAAKQTTLHVTVHVRDIDVAVQEVEARLVQVNGRLIERQRRDAREFLKAEVAAQNLAAFLDRIETIGRVKTERGPRDPSGGTVAVNIQIIGEP